MRKPFGLKIIMQGLIGVIGYRKNPKLGSSSEPKVAVGFRFTVLHFCRSEMPFRDMDRCWSVCLNCSVVGHHASLRETTTQVKQPAGKRGQGGSGAAGTPLPKDCLCASNYILPHHNLKEAWKVE